MDTLNHIWSKGNHVFHENHYTISILIGLVIIAWLYNRFRVNRSFFLTTQTIHGKTILITGGVSGIGYATAKDLLRRGARVILADFNLQQGSQAVQKLVEETGCNPDSIRLMKCDLSSLESVRKFAAQYNDQEKRLDVLICNAGVFWTPNLMTTDGFNTVMQVNYLGHFLLTNLLLDKLKQSGPSRIVYVASGAHRSVWSIDWSDAFTQYKSFRLWGTYSMSKAFILLYAHKLKHDLESSDVDVFALNPSWVWTSIQKPMREAIGFIPFIIAYPILYMLKCILAKTPEAGAQTSVFCAVEPSLQKSHDLYFEDCAVESVSSLCKNDQLAHHLWELSSQAVSI